MERGVKVRSLVISLALLGSVAAVWLVSSVPSAAQSGAVRDPVAHCRTVGNQNEPPGWDRAPRAIARAAGGSAHNYGVHWRCADGQVLVCAVEDMHEVSCSKRDRRRQAEVPGYCRQVPNASFIPFSEGNRRSVYDWRCRGTIPVIARREHRGAPVWLYYFSYVPERQRTTRPGTNHASEIPFVFDSLDAVPGRTPLVTPSERALTRLVHSCWVAFARRGVPACDGQAWPAYDPSTDQLLEFGIDTGVRTAFRRRQLDAHEAANAALLR